MTSWIAACQASLSITNSQSLLKLMSIKLVMPCNHLILCHPLLPLLSILPSIRVFSSESVLHIRWPKYWSFSFSISPSSEYSGLISFRMDWLDLLAAQGTQESSSIPQFKSINSSALSFLFSPTFTSIEVQSLHSTDEEPRAYRQNTWLQIPLLGCRSAVDLTWDWKQKPLFLLGLLQGKSW